MLNRDKAQKLTKETLQQNPALALLFLRRWGELKTAQKSKANTSKPAK